MNLFRSASGEDSEHLVKDLVDEPDAALNQVKSFQKRVGEITPEAVEGYMFIVQQLTDDPGETETTVEFAGTQLTRMLMLKRLIQQYLKAEGIIDFDNFI